MTSEAEEGPFYLEEVSIPNDSDDDFQYEEVPVEDEASTVDFLEDLNDAVYAIEEARQNKLLAGGEITSSREATVTQRPEVIDDFVRNFFLKMGLNRTLECFQTEWYELQQKGLLGDEDIGVVPDAYARNQFLNDEVKRLKKEVDKFRSAGSKAREAFIKMQKERDYHRMHHRRVVQEKNRLIEDMKRLKSHYKSYEPTLRQLKHKYELAMKEKMLTRLERDRVVGQATGLQATLRNLESGKDEPIPSVIGYRAERMHKPEGPTQRALRESRMEKEAVKFQTPPEESAQSVKDTHYKDSEFPHDDCVNPLLSLAYPVPTHLTRAGGLKLTSTIKAHDLAVSSVRIHPRKQVAVTTSDDRLWKMWSLPDGEIIMTGDGHTDWIADCDFHPEGKQLVTGGGDTTVKVWDFAQASCVLTLSEHTHAVWGVTWHSCGDFIASCSMDSTSKIWDVNSERCRSTLRGHTDSVNSIMFLHYSNTLLTSSADKTLSLWDARTGICAQTFYGHMHSVNHAIFNLKGNTIASCDSYGIVKLWDTREISPRATINVGPHPANKLAFDPTGKILAVASNDGTVKMIDMSDNEFNYISGHQDAVQTVSFDRTGQFLLTGGSDGILQLWS
ncbi:sperm-associated antigen 16 protein-like [Styela clava]